MLKLKLLYMFILLVLTIPPAYSISSGFSMSNNDQTVGTNARYFSDYDDVLLDTASVSSGQSVSLQHAIFGAGDLDETHSVSNLDGSWAKVNVKVTGADSSTYTYSLYPGAGGGYNTSYVEASESLTVDFADSIACNASAGNANGNSAEVGIVVQEGSLNGYTNSARASTTEVTATQGANWVTGQDIEFTASSTNQEGDSASMRTHANGGNTSYSGYAKATDNLAAVAISRLSGRFNNATITHQFNATNAAYDYAIGYMLIQNGVLSEYSGSAAGRLTGSAISINKGSAQAANENGLINQTLVAVHDTDRASTTTEVVDGWLNGYSGSAKASPSSVSVSVTNVDANSSDKITHKMTAENDGLDMALSQTEVIATDSGNINVSGSAVTLTDGAMINVNELVATTDSYLGQTLFAGEMQTPLCIEDAVGVSAFSNTTITEGGQIDYAGTAVSRNNGNIADRTATINVKKVNAAADYCNNYIRAKNPEGDVAISNSTVVSGSLDLESTVIAKNSSAEVSVTNLQMSTFYGTMEQISKATNEEGDEATLRTAVYSNGPFSTLNINGTAVADKTSSTLSLKNIEVDAADGYIENCLYAGGPAYMIDNESEVYFYAQAAKSVDCGNISFSGIAIAKLANDLKNQSALAYVTKQNATGSIIREELNSENYEGDHANFEMTVYDGDVNLKGCALTRNTSATVSLSYLDANTYDELSASLNANNAEGDYAESLTYLTTNDEGNMHLEGTAEGKETTATIVINDLNLTTPSGSATHYLEAGTYIDWLPCLVAVSEETVHAKSYTNVNGYNDSISFSGSAVSRNFGDSINMTAAVSVKNLFAKGSDDASTEMLSENSEGDVTDMYTESYDGYLQFVGSGVARRTNTVVSVSDLDAYSNGYGITNSLTAGEDTETYYETMSTNGMLTVDTSPYAKAETCLFGEGELHLSGSIVSSNSADLDLARDYVELSQMDLTSDDYISHNMYASNSIGGEVYSSTNVVEGESNMLSFRGYSEAHKSDAIIGIRSMSATGYIITHDLSSSLDTTETLSLSSTEYSEEEPVYSTVHVEAYDGDILSYTGVSRAYTDNTYAYQTVSAQGYTVEGYGEAQNPDLDDYDVIYGGYRFYNYKYAGFYNLARTTPTSAVEVHRIVT